VLGQDGGECAQAGRAGQQRGLFVQGDPFVPFEGE
jgi:hypothetical protein